MKFLAVALLLAVALCGSVEVLTTETFAKTKGTQKMMVKFYAPWCGHCKSLAPIYEELVDEMADEDILIAEVDCTNDQDLCSAHGVQGFPTLMYFEPSGAAAKYESARSVDAMKGWLTMMMGPATRDALLSDVQDVTGPIQFFLLTPDDHSREVFEKAASGFKGKFPFYVVEDKRAPAHFNVEAPTPTLLAIHEGEQDTIECEAKQAVATFIKTNSRIVFPELGPQNFRQLATEPNKSIAIVFVTDLEAEDEIAEGRAFAKEDDSGRFNWAYMGADKWGHFAKQYGVEEFPAVAVLDVATESYWHFPWTKAAEEVPRIISGEFEGTPIPKREQ